MAAEPFHQRVGIELSVTEQQARRSTAEHGRAARRGLQFAQPAMAQGPPIVVVAQSQSRLLQGVQCVEHVFLVGLRHPGQAGNQVAGPGVRGPGEFNDAGQVMRFQRLARDMQHQDLLDGPDQRDERPVLGHEPRGSLEQIGGVAMQAHPASFQKQPRCTIRPPALARSLGRRELLEHQSGRRFLERRSVQRPLDERRFGCGAPAALPDFLDAFEPLPGDVIGPGHPFGERDGQEPQAVKEPAELPGAGVAIEVQGKLADIDPIELDLEHRGGPPEVLDQRRNAGLGRHVSHPITGQQLPRQGENRQALHLLRALDVDRADSIQQVFARWPAVPAQGRQSAHLLERRDLVGDRDRDVPPSAPRGPARRAGRRLASRPRSAGRTRARACRWRNRSTGRAARSHSASGSPVRPSGRP